MRILGFNPVQADDNYVADIVNNITYCRQGNRIVLGDITTIEWELDIRWGFMEGLFGNPNYSLSLETLDGHNLQCFTIIGYNQIIPGNGHYNFNVNFNPQLLEVEYIRQRIQQDDNVEIEYKIKLLESGREICSSGCQSINLIVSSNCNICLDREFFSFEPSYLTADIPYSDATFDNRGLHVVNLRMNMELDNIRTVLSRCEVAISASYGLDDVPLKFDDPDGYLCCIDSNRYSVNVPAEQQFISIPVLIDMSSVQILENEISELGKVRFTYEFKYSVCGMSYTNKKGILELPLTISPNYVRLGVSLFETNINGARIRRPLLCNNETQLSDIRLSNGTGETVTKGIVIKNMAQDKDEHMRNKGLVIRNVRTDFANREEVLKRIEGDIDEFSEGLVNNNTDEKRLLADEICQLDLVFEFDKIKDIVVKDNNGIFDLKLNIRFQYLEERTEEYIDNNGFLQYRMGRAEWRSYQTTVVVKIYKKDPMKWYSVDFGTSAVVACCMDRSKHVATVETLDLKVSKNQLLMRTYPNNPDVRKDFSETTEKLIASTLYFNAATENKKVNLEMDSDIKESKFSSLPLWFSPGSGMTPDERYRLPCLKNMMGHTNIPNISIIPEFREKYSHLKVNDIMMYSYNQFFHYYLNDCKVEALVLTIPNTFTPLHVEQLREVVMVNLPSLQKNMLEFVSESDSVLCSYVADKMQVQKSTSVERVLVYDMGAGTLDLTFANCTFGYAGCNIEILRKVGVNKAGNYIDYLLGEIICDFLSPDWGKKFRDLLNIHKREGDYRKRKKLKDYLRNSVKTMLNENGDTSLPELDFEDGTQPCKDLKNIKVKDIIGSRKFKDYLGSCTVDVLNDLFNGISKNVDVVLLSGRSISINAISESLKKFIESKATYIKASETPGYTLKTIVAKGALDYKRMNHYARTFSISRKKVYGSYGLLLMNGSVPQQWFTLIDTSTAPVNKDVPVDLLEYEANRTIDLSASDRVYLCHTYSSGLNSTTNISMDSMSVLHNYDVPMTQRIGNMIIRLKITSNNKLDYMIGNIQPKDLYPRDDYSNESLRKSLWPVVYE